MAGTDPKLQNPIESARPLTEAEYKSSIAALIQDSDEFSENDLQVRRARGWRYWRGEVDLKAQKDRTDLVSTDVLDVVESMVPQLMKIFAGAEDIVEFKADGPSPEDALFAAKATAACNMLFWSDDGWSKLVDWIRDSLIAGTGVWKVWHEEEETYTEDEYEGIDKVGLQAMALDDNVELLAVEGDPEVEPVSIIARNRHLKRRYHIESIPPEELLVNREAIHEDDARILGQRTVVRVSDLVEMGVPYETAITLRSTEVENAETEIEREARRGYVTEDQDTITLDKASWPVYLQDVYVRIDRDGDGYTELRHCIVAGEAVQEIIHDEAVEYCPYIVTSPIRTPHSIIGRSIADITFDIQDQSTFVMRQMLDNLAWSNNPRNEVVENSVNMIDMNDNKFAGNVRVRQPGMVRPLVMPFTAHQTLPILEYLEDRRKWRTGVSEQSMGMNAEALQSSTEVGVRGILGQSQVQVEMVARTLAEDGIARLFKKLVKLLVEYQDDALQIPQSSGQWAEFNPQGWLPEMSTRVNVGLGTGQVDEKLEALGAIAQKQEQIIMQMGPDNPLCNLAQYAATLQKLVELSPVANPAKYFNSPEQVMQAQQAQQQPKGGEDQEAQVKAAEAQAKAQTAVQVAQIKAQTDLKIAEIKAQVDAMTKQQGASIDAQTSIQVAQINAQVDEAKTELQSRLKLLELEAEAALEKYAVDMKADTDVRLRSPVNGS